MIFQFDKNQREAVDKLKNGNILCGKVGSGKSRVSLVYYFEKECGGSIEPPYSTLTNHKDLYIITTARKRDFKDWEKEISEFFMFADDIEKLKVTIDSWNNISKYVDVRDSFFIFDEQRVVGSGAWVTSFYKITSSQVYSNNQHNNNWILLSATPGDTWEDYIPVFVANNFYRSKTQFLNEHAVFNPYFTSYRVIDRFVHEDILYEYRDRILVDIKVEQIPRKYNWITVDYDRDIYKQIAGKRWNPFDNVPVENASDFCYLLRKCVNLNNERLKTVIDIYNQYGKVIVFYNFDYELDALRIMCHKFNIEKGEWNGHKHDSIPDTDKWLYLVQYTAGAEGWNCTETNVIVFFSLNYSYKATEQASGRIDRRDTKFETLNYYFIVTDSWIDRAIKKALGEKKNFNYHRYVKDSDFSKSA